MLSVPVIPMVLRQIHIWHWQHDGRITGSKVAMLTCQHWLNSFCKVSDSDRCMHVSPPLVGPG